MCYNCIPYTTLDPSLLPPNPPFLFFDDFRLILTRRGELAPPIDIVAGLLCGQHPFPARCVVEPFFGLLQCQTMTKTSAVRDRKVLSTFYSFKVNTPRWCSFENTNRQTERLKIARDQSTVDDRTLTLLSLLFVEMIPRKKMNRMMNKRKHWRRWAS